MQLKREQSDLIMSPTKKMLFYLLLIFLICIFIEICSLGVYRLIVGDFSFSKSQIRRNAIMSTLKDDFGKQRKATGKSKNWNVLHPYLGYVTEGVNFDKNCDDETNCDRRFKTYDDFPFTKRSEEKVIVGVLGGSFAHGVSINGAKINGNDISASILQRYLEKIPQFQGKEILLYHMAVGGYKQPQQVLKLEYYLALGAEFDIIINIDGFNEIALPDSENLPRGVHPLFPRSWYYFVDGALNKKLLTFYGIRAYEEQRQTKFATLCSSFPFKYSISVNLLWEFVNKRIVNKIKQADVDLIAYKGSDVIQGQYVTTGPDYTFTNSEDFYQEMAQAWARCSKMIHDQCKGFGIQYFHFLQPNQYVEGSKPMSDNEKGIALSLQSIYGNSARKGYPYLIKEGNWLIQEKIPYFDLTMIFMNNNQELYVDNCCHLNSPGYALVAQEIAEIVKENYRVEQ